MLITPSVLGPRLSLEAARALPANFISFDNFPEKTSSIILGENKSLAACDLRFLFDYQIFPPNVLRSLPEWRADGRPEMRLGDVIVQRAFVPPIGGGICLEFAVRVRELFSDSNRIGFSYETLVGHAEQGVSEFYFSQDDDGLRFFIHTFSQPGHWTSRVFRGLALRYQSWCTQRALQYVSERFALHNANWS